ncbi:hypothetical protein F4824DRAFT_277571 [Ustulina deusta]|nr:hypothetical protein F4824DRAFT_277571 [Ustulina deusta]
MEYLGLGFLLSPLLLLSLCLVWHTTALGTLNTLQYNDLPSVVRWKPALGIRSGHSPASQSPTRPNPPPCLLFYPLSTPLPSPPRSWSVVVTPTPT